MRWRFEATSRSQIAPNEMMGTNAWVWSCVDGRETILPVSRLLMLPVRS